MGRTLAAFVVGCTAALFAAAAPVRAADRGPPSLQAVAARYGDALLVVYTMDGARAGTGFFVASRGVGVATVQGGAPGDEVVVELAGGERRRGVVRAVDGGSSLVLVEVVRLPKDAGFAALGLAKSARRPDEKAWLVGLDVDAQGNAAPMLGGVRRVDASGTWHIDVPCGPGAPVLDGKGRVVAVATSRAGRTASKGVSADRVRALLAAWGDP